MTTGLPIIGAGYGLPKSINIEKAIFKLNTYSDWDEKLETILNESRNSRTEKADYCKNFVLKNLSIESGFEKIIEIINY